MTPSRHLVGNLALYEQSFSKGFEQFYGDIKESALFALLPKYLEREGSSLVYMADKLIDNAADQSDFNENKCYRYLLKRSQVFNGHLINGQTAIEIIREFVKKHPVGYFEETPCEEVPSFEEKDSVPEQTTETEEVAEEQTEIQENLEKK